VVGVGVGSLSVIGAWSWSYVKLWGPVNLEYFHHSSYVILDLRNTSLVAELRSQRNHSEIPLPKLPPRKRKNEDPLNLYGTPVGKDGS